MKLKLENEYLPVANAPKWQTNPSSRSRCSLIRKCITYPAILILSVLSVYQHVYGELPFSRFFLVNHDVSSQINHSLHQLDSGVPSGSTTDAEGPEYHEIFEVSVPAVDYGVPVYSEVVLDDYSFGNSWGKPAMVGYTPPEDLDFNRVVVNISTVVSGVQYDRLAHLYLSDVQIWRTSTAEPGGKSVISNITKDASDYLSLFKKPGKLVYQLDNLVNNKLTGIFNVTITVHYYNYNGDAMVSSLGSSMLKSFESSVLPSQANSSLLNQIKLIYSVVYGPPSTITPLTGNNDGTPLRYLPNDDVSYTLSPLSRKTIAASARVHVSGNAAEEFWYSNVLDENVHKFESHGHHLLGKGPVRVLKFYLNDQLVAIEAPKPVIFTGGISPSLWNPVVGTNAFDLGAIDINLTPYLPLLWSKTNKLTVEVVTGTQHATLSFFSDDDLGITVEPKITPGNNWIVSAALFGWENPDITFASGLVPNATVVSKKEFAMNLGRFKPSQANQIISYSESVYGVGILQLATSQSPKPIEFGLNSSASVKFSNVQNYKKFADVESTVSTIKNNKKFSLLDPSTNFTTSLATVGKKVSYVSVFNLEITMGPTISYDVSLVQVEESKVKANGNNLYNVGKSQNGSSLFFLDPKGNHGTGKLETKIKAKIPGAADYHRKVVAENGTIVEDEVLEFEEVDAKNWEDDEHIIEIERLTEALMEIEEAQLL